VEHVVFFPAPDGTPAFRRLVSLDEAVRLVEHLRNVEGVAQVSVHALNEVPLSFRAYYRVEVPSALDAPQEPTAEAPKAEVPLQAVPTVEPVAVAEVAPEPVPVLALVVLALVGDLPVDDLPVDPRVAEPASYAEEPAPEYVPEPALASVHGRGGPASLGFFA